MTHRSKTPILSIITSLIGKKDSLAANIPKYYYKVIFWDKIEINTSNNSFTTPISRLCDA